MPNNAIVISGYKIPQNGILQHQCIFYVDIFNQLNG